MLNELERGLRDVLERAVAEGEEEVVEVAICRSDELLLEMRVTAPGISLPERALFPIFSCGKGVTATAVLRLAERGILSVDAPIADVWPAFACNGKAEITLRQVLTHTSGLALLPEYCASAGTDWEAMCRLLEQAVPQHPPGTQTVYHAITFAWLVGETMRRADGREMARILLEEVSEPLGLDLYFGVPEEDLDRCVDAVRGNPYPPELHSGPHAIPSWSLPLEDWINRSDVRRACIPASNGFGTARALARHYAALAEGELLSEETLSAAIQPSRNPEPESTAAFAWGLGYQLRGGPENPGAIFGHGGYGGTLGVADLRTGFGVGIVKNCMGGELREEILRLVLCQSDRVLSGRSN